jgi:fatty-acyl-CoA synthase
MHTAREARQEANAAWIRALGAIKILDHAPPPTLPGLLEARAQDCGGRPALLGETESSNYRMLAAAARHYAGWAASQALPPGQVVALLMPNCPEYPAIWLGLSAAGCTVALLNTNLAGAALAHCIRAAGASHIIIAAALIPRLPGIAAHLPAALVYWAHGEGGSMPRIDSWTGPPAALDQPRGGAETALLIFTSGTTGLPKAAKITHRRIVEWSAWFAGMMDVQPDDRLYNCLPMYHSVGGVVAIGAMLYGGGSVVVRERFSARKFWADVSATGCTIFQYIGELCRYLLSTTPAPHQLRLACGNGLRGDVWEALQTRFAIPKILEFYAATEGNVSLYNCEGKPGAIGRIPAYLKHRFPVALIAIGDDCEPRRDAAGFCLPAATGEPGEAIGKIAASAESQFDGYTDPRASAKKILTDVFAPGDRWFRTGDLLRKDAEEFYYFVDRLGDTFRWKGENVSTTEVERVISQCPGITGAAVYGVAIPGEEGRAGMAAITIAAGFTHETLLDRLKQSLPGYARPLFIRVRDTLETTTTFKVKKDTLIREAYEAEDVWRYDYENTTASRLSPRARE